MRAIAIFIAATTGLSAVATIAGANSAAAEAQCFDKGTLSYVDCPKPAAPVAPPPAPAPVFAAPPAPLWGGCYVGVHVGYTRSKTETRVQDGTPTSTFDEQNEDESVAGGGHVGCLFDAPGQFVLGFEVDGTGVNLGGSSAAANPAALTSGSAATHIDWLASARLRAGYAHDRWLPFLTGGVAFAGWRGSSQFVDPGGVSTFSFDETAVGVVGGVGLDYFLSEHWSLGVEGLYYYFDDDVSGPLARTPPITGTARASLDDILVGRVRLNFNF